MEFDCKVITASVSFAPVRLLNRYIMSNFVTTFAGTLLVVTFVMCLGAIFQVSDMLARGVPWRPIAVIFLSAIPMVCAFSIPISSVTTSLLVFERLSGDGEITAMKACGISIWQIVSRPVLFAVFLTGVCMYINTELVAGMHYLHRKTIYEHKEELARAMWEPGRFVREVPGLAVYVGKSEYDEITGRYAVKNIIIYDKRAGSVEREIRASSGYIEQAPGGKGLKISLRGNVRVDPLIEGRPDAGFMDSYNVNVDLGSLTQTPYRKRMADLTAGELLDGILSVQKSPAYKMSMSVELNQRIVLSLSCLAFVLLGIPFGITTKRTTSSAGIAISLVMVFSFYLFIVLVDSLARRPELRPDLIIWTPAVVSIALGLCLLRRIR